MCSLAGFVSKRPVQFREELGRAMIAGGVRGDYSCGVWLDNGHYARALGSPGDFVKRGPYRSLWGTATMALAHTRWPTAGGMKKRDTQPYYHRAADVVTTHNGHVSAALVEAAEDRARVLCHNEVDSAIFKALLAGEAGLEGVAGLLGEAWGPQAVAVRVRGKVYLARVGGQPLCWAARDGVVMWASTVEQVRAAMGKRVDVWAVPENVVCVVDPGASEPGVFDVMPIVRKVKPWVWNYGECGNDATAWGGVGEFEADKDWDAWLARWRQAKKNGVCVLCGEPAHGEESLCHWCARLDLDEGDGRS